MQSTIEIRSDDLSGDATRRLVAFHLAALRGTAPPESVHALDVDALRRPGISVWSAWAEDRIAGIAALRELAADRGEIKSMRVDDGFRGAGVGRALLEHVVRSARERGMTSLWLETGTTEDFAPAHRLYESAGFVDCEAFEGYRPDPHSRFMTLTL
ncbi:GNAT family N-acetyltransferase [Microbacterium jejuense]|uniref:GNAT family N-acetyltransferase n=1 Tax=Microbacterium jejuense TaxID=1263637 RepID=A0ABS7HKI1_9MICO|nr:GNAT family N-acetyltransferase [Microbacterium jejuense]MBW9093245.1 GNAT family N-acetyltransferase [Microbacterium jejuense]